jgi:hypothetical protein
LRALVHLDTLSPIADVAPGDGAATGSVGQFRQIP